MSFAERELSAFEKRYNYDFSEASDRDSDFDDDGVTAFEESRLVPPGNPLGDWSVEIIDVPDITAPYFLIDTNNRGEIVLQQQSQSYVCSRDSSGRWVWSVIPLPLAGDGSVYPADRQPRLIASGLTETGTVYGKVAISNPATDRAFVWDPVFGHVGLDPVTVTELGDDSLYPTKFLPPNTGLFEVR